MKTWQNPSNPMKTWQNPSDVHFLPIFMTIKIIQGHEIETRQHLLHHYTGSIIYVYTLHFKFSKKSLQSQVIIYLMFNYTIMIKVNQTTNCHH